MQFLIVILLLTAGVAAACAPRVETASVVQIGERLVEDVTSTPNQIFVTPTQQPTSIPTLAISSPTLEPSATPESTATPDAQAVAAQCQAVLDNLYRQAIEMCIGKPGGYFCNAGVAPEVEPGGRIASALGAPGAVVDATQISRVHSQPLLMNNSGGVVYLRLPDELNLNAVMIGDVNMQDVTAENFNLPPWQTFNVTTNHGNQGTCAPNSTLVVQSGYGQRARIAVNGVSMEVLGTVAIQTHDDRTVFMVLEGGGTFIITGRRYEMVAGQEVTAQYNAGDWSRPIAQPEAGNLEEDLLDGLPVQILDRPVLIPEGGFGVTTANVNMRTEPSLEGRLIYQVPDNEVVSLLGKSENSEWYHIRLGNGDTGWMSAELLSVRTGNMDTLYNATPEPPQRPGDLGRLAKVIANSGGNLRAAPDVSFNTIVTLPAGTDVELLARSPYSPWVKVNAGGTIGWLSLLTVETASAIGFLPIDYDVPAPARPTAVPVFDWGGGHAYPNPTGG